MSEQENITSSEDDVEAHKRKAAMNSEEPKLEGEADDDVELHKKKSVQ